MKATKILAGIFFALAAMFALFAWKLNENKSQVTSAAQVQSVDANMNGLEASASNTALPQYERVVATAPIRAGQRIEVSDVHIALHEEDVAGGFQELDQVVGKTTLIALEPGLPVLAHALLSSLSLQLETGQRAVSIGVREPMAAGHHVAPGDFVDVFFTLEGNDHDARQSRQTRLLLSRTRVLAYGHSTVEDAVIAEAQGHQDGEQGSAQSRRSQRVDGPQRMANTALLAVALEDVERLTLAERFGQLSLALRHPNDTGMPDPALFADLPAVLRPLGIKAISTSQLSPEDRAYAGTRWSDLVKGGEAEHVPQASRQRIARSMPRNTVRPTPPAALLKDSVELYQGDVLQTVHY